MTRPTKSIAQRLLDAELAINNSLNSPEILTAVTAFGYDQARLEAAHALYAEARELTEQQAQEYGEQYEATQTVREAWDKAALAYSATIKIARVAFRDNPTAQKSLALTGIRKQSLNGWLDQARQFYNNMRRHPEYIAAMTPFSYDQTKLEAEAALVEAVAAANEMQETEQGQAQAATRLRDAKLDELDQWLADFKAIAEVALSASPQQLEQLGWVVA